MKTITTPSGHIVEFKEYLTFGERRAVNRLMTDKIKINIQGGKSVSDPLPASVMIDMQNEIFKRVIVSITEKGKEKVMSDGDGTKLIQLVESWEEADGQFVFDEIDKNFNPQQSDEEKKTP